MAFGKQKTPQAPSEQAVTVDALLNKMAAAKMPKGDLKDEEFNKKFIAEKKKLIGQLGGKIETVDDEGIPVVSSIGKSPKDEQKVLEQAIKMAGKELKKMKQDTEEAKALAAAIADAEKRLPPKEPSMATKAMQQVKGQAISTMQQAKDQALSAVTPNLQGLLAQATTGVTDRKKEQEDKEAAAKLAKARDAARGGPSFV
jgi:hypothetical protein